LQLGDAVQNLMESNNSRLDAAEQRAVIIVMVKAPRAGEAKTRLMPLLSERDASAIAACFVQDVVAGARRVARDVIVAYTPPDGLKTLQSLLPRDLLWMEQQGADLGARLEAAVWRAAALGFRPIIVIGADSPTLPPRLIEEAIRALAMDEADLVLGPAEDGGYYLIGFREPVRNLFQSVAWSTSFVYRQTAEAAARMGLRLRQLPLFYDVDTPADLLRLRDEIHADEEARERAQATSRWLLEHEQLPTFSSD
jgi:uncharacterized protein